MIGRKREDSGGKCRNSIKKEGKREKNEGIINAEWGKKKKYYGRKKC